MQLEKEIHSRFQSPKHKAGVNLIYTGNWFSSIVSGLLKKHGITMQQYNILRIVRGASPHAVSIKYIRERMLEKMSDVSRVVDKIKEKQWIYRKERKSDRRNVDITITQAGLDKLNEIEEFIGGINKVFDKLSPSEVDQLNFLLDKLRD